MCKYKIQLPIVGFQKDQLISEAELMNAVQLPLEVSTEDFLMALIYAGVIKFTLPVEFSKTINMPGTAFSSQIVKYKSVNEESDLYESEIPGLPCATFDELIELGYEPLYDDKMDNRPYIQFDNDLRKYAGESVYYFFPVSDEIVFLMELVLTDEWLTSLGEVKQIYFPTPEAAFHFLDKHCEDCPANEKLFSLNDIKRFINESEGNNGSTFAQNMATGIIDNALFQMVELKKIAS